MLFYSFFKSLVGKEVTVELKNDLAITGTLHSVDQYLNIKLNDIFVTEQGLFTFQSHASIIFQRKIPALAFCEKLLHPRLCSAIRAPASRGDRPPTPSRHGQKGSGVEPHQRDGVKISSN